MILSGEDMAWDLACEMFNTEMPTDDQLTEAYDELESRIEMEANEDY